MKTTGYLILGAGPSGLTYGRRLMDKGITDFIILEKEESAGGLCRSQEVDGKPLDIGGGHFLDVRRPKVCDFVFRFLPQDQWNIFDRDSRIRVDGCEVSHPLEASIWQFPEKIQDRYLNSIKKAGCNTGAPMPTHFKDWIRWKLGDEIADNYMIPYNSKMFADSLDELGTYWLEKLPNVSFEETLQSVKEHRSLGTQPGHARFYYPKDYGYGEPFLRMADSMQHNIVYNAPVKELSLKDRTVTTMSGEKYQAQKIITTIPWDSMMVTDASSEVKEAITKLKHSSVEIRYVNEDPGSKAHWIYVPSLEVPYHRILCRCNFCLGSRGYWVETVKSRAEAYKASKWIKNFAYMNDYAYPLNTIDKREAIALILKEAASFNVIGLGRWGEHEHYNSDVVIEKAMELADNE